MTVLIVIFLIFTALLLASFIYCYVVKARNSAIRRYAKFVLEKAFPVWLVVVLLMITFAAIK